ncbi:MAG TPA: hypothetical protein VKV57_00220 [bacterium]|nr:hypothetical protein [bacterium]
MLLAIAFMLITALIVVAISNLTISELGASRTLDKGTQAFTIADGAVERAVAVLRLDKDWSVKVGATQNIDTNGVNFKPLVDQFQPGGGNAVGQGFPAGNPIGTYSIEVREAAVDPTNNIWVRTLGTYGGVSRSLEVELHRLTPADFSTYSAGTYSALKGGGGNVTIHGSAYFYSDLLIKAVQTGFYNDRAINIGDPAPYTNQLFVRGTLDMSKGNASIGTSSQPMWGVHATHINNMSKNVYTDELDNVVPVISYPNVAGYIACLTGQPGCPAGVTATSPGNALSTTTGPMVICTGVSQPSTTTDLTFSGTYFYVPTQGNANCAAAPPTVSAYMLLWDPSKTVPLTLNSSQAGTPLLVPGVITTQQAVTYTGKGTLVAANINGQTNALDTSNGGQILAQNPASGTGDILGCGYTNSSSMPTTDLLGFIVGGSATMQGNSTKCNQEQDVALVVGETPSTNMFTSTKNVQIFGMVVTEQLDTTQNPDFWQVPGLQQALPTPMLQVLSATGAQPVTIVRWHELTPQE